MVMNRFVVPVVRRLWTAAHHGHPRMRMRMRMTWRWSRRGFGHPLGDLSLDPHSTTTCSSIDRGAVLADPQTLEHVVVVAHFRMMMRCLWGSAYGDIKSAYSDHSFVFAFVFPFCFFFQWLKFLLPVVVLCDYEGTMCRRWSISCGESIECEICKYHRIFRDRCYHGAGPRESIPTYANHCPHTTRHHYDSFRGDSGRIPRTRASKKNKRFRAIRMEMSNERQVRMI